MKSKFKKLLATALVLCLVLALLPAAAFAASQYTFTFNNDSGSSFSDGKYTFGQITVNGDTYDASKYNDGDRITLKAEPKPNCALAVFEVTVGGVAQTITDDDTCTFDLTGNVVVKAAFRELLDVNVEQPEHATITVAPEKATKGTLVTVTVAPEDGYSVSEVFYETTGNQRETITGNSFVMPPYDVTVKAAVTESPKYDITTTTTGTASGTVLTDPSGSTYAGKTVSVITRAAGAIADGITVYKTGDSSVSVDYNKEAGTFVMPEYPVTVSVNFVPFTPPTTDYYYIATADKITGGKIWSSANSAKAGDVVTIYVDPDWGWMTDDVYYTTSEGAGIVPPSQHLTHNYDTDYYEVWSFVMPAGNVWVYAEFEPYFPGHDYHAINVTSDGHCSVDVKNWAYCGEDVTIKLSNFDTGYAFSYLKVNGEFVKPHGFNGYLSYTFEMPHSDVAIEVGTTSVSGMYYIDTSYDSTLGGVEVWVNNNYVNNWHQGSWANNNDSVSFKVKPYYSDDVVSVSVVGKRTGWTYSCDYSSYSGWYTFTMPKEDVTINVDFRSGVHKVYVDKVTDGKLTVSDDWAKFGQIVYITAVPDYGCTLSSLSVRTATGDSVHVYNAQKADTYYFYMPDQYVSVSAVFTGKYTSLPFNDVSYGDWYYDAVQFVYSRGIMDGVDYYKFAPNGTITRGMILTMLWRMAGEPFEMPVTSFTDVEIGRYYTTAVAWACRNGIADGMGESTFGPNDAITREELVTLMYRYAQYFGHSCIGTSIEGFADAGSVSSYAYNAMCWAYKAGVVTGTTGSRLNPQGTASRAEAAQMIMSFYSFLNS